MFEQYRSAQRMLNEWKLKLNHRMSMSKRHKRFFLVLSPDRSFVVYCIKKKKSCIKTNQRKLQSLSKFFPCMPNVGQWEGWFRRVQEKLCIKKGTKICFGIKDSEKEPPDEFNIHLKNKQTRRRLARIFLHQTKQRRLICVHHWPNCWMGNSGIRCKFRCDIITSDRDKRTLISHRVTIIRCRKDRYTFP